MRNEPISIYLREVLGASTPTADPVSVASRAPVVVVTEELTEFTKTLLSKILSSIRLENWQHQELNREPIPAMHRLLFSGDGCRRSEKDGEVHWNLPSLTQMLGEGPEVTNAKRSAWAMLQEFSREFKTR